MNRAPVALILCCAVLFGGVFRRAQQPSSSGMMASQKIASGVTPIALVAHISATNANGLPGTATTSAINTTGATLIVVAFGFYNGTTAVPTLTDSKTNTWTGLTVHTNTIYSVRMFYCANPTVGSGHTFTETGVDTYPSVAVAAFSGTLNAAADGESAGGTATAATTVQPGTLTPSADNAVVVTAMVYPPTAAGTASINSSFILSDSQNGNNADGSFSVALAYKVQTTAGAENPTWTSPTLGILAAAAAAFKHS